MDFKEITFDQTIFWNACVTVIIQKSFSMVNGHNSSSNIAMTGRQILQKGGYVHLQQKTFYNKGLEILRQQIFLFILPTEAKSGGKHDIHLIKDTVIYHHFCH